MRRLVLHDYFESPDGGGRLALILARELDADIGYGFKMHNHPYFENSNFHGNEYPLISFTSIPVWRQFLLSIAFKRKARFHCRYDTVIYSGSYAPLAVGNHTASRNMYYCHTPPRFLYNQRQFFHSSIPAWQRPLLIAFCRYFQPLYEKAVRQMDLILTNSRNVRQRIKKYLSLDSSVIYPPCETEKYTWLEKGEYYLSMGRLDSLKRVDRIIQAFFQMPDKRLIVLSDGPELKQYKKMVQGYPHIDILGKVTEKKMAELLGRCIATIYIPKDEDFGMSPVESMAAGKPVIGVAEGGLLETVVDSETGILMRPDFTVADIRDAVTQMIGPRALSMRPACEARAGLFTRERFVNRMEELMESVSGREHFRRKIKSDAPFPTDIPRHVSEPGRRR